MIMWLQLINRGVTFNLLTNHSQMEVIKIGIVEDDKLIRNSLQSCVDLVPNMVLAFADGSVESAIDTIQSETFNGVDVILQDIGLPGMDGIQGLPHIKKLLPNVDIIMLTTYDETDKIFAALCNGARSYISKKTSLKVIMDAICTVHRGGAYMSPSIARKVVEHLGSSKPKKIDERLTDRQMEIVVALSEGLSYKMVADKHGLSIDTIRSHIKKIYKILEVNSKIELLNLYKNT